MGAIKIILKFPADVLRDNEENPIRAWKERVVCCVEASSESLSDLVDEIVGGSPEIKMIGYLLFVLISC